MTASAAPRDPRAGFTLLEVLLALGIFAATTALLLSSFAGAERAREHLAGRTREARQIHLALDRIATDLQGALSAEWIAGTALSCREDAFSGRPAATLSFTAFSLPGPGPRPSTDVAKVRYFVRVGEDGTSLELHREESALPLVPNKMPTRETRIVDRIGGFSVQLDGGDGWVEAWPPGGGRAAALPRRAAVTLADPSGRSFRRVVSLPLAGNEGAVLGSGKRKPEQR